MGAQNVPNGSRPRCRGAAGTMCKASWHAALSMESREAALRAADNLLAIVCCCEPIGAKP
jgi:hypothetical protein